MEDYIQEACIQTPTIHFSRSTGLMVIKGRAIPDNPEAFWSGIVAWFERYMHDPHPHTEFRIDLEYFNISSSKRILFLLYKLNEIVERGFSAKVQWFYRETDEEMYEVGQDYAFMIKVPFEFKEYSDHDLALVI